MATGRNCSIAAALDVVGDRWSLLVIRELGLGNHRFSGIVEKTGAPRDRLAARLKHLVEAGIVERRRYSDAPPRAEYHLTKAGRELGPVLRSLLAWGDRWAVDYPPVTLMHHDHALDARTVCTTCGEQVHDRDLSRVLNS